MSLPKRLISLTLACIMLCTLCWSAPSAQAEGTGETRSGRMLLHFRYQMLGSTPILSGLSLIITMCMRMC